MIADQGGGWSNSPIPRLNLAVVQVLVAREAQAIRVSRMDIAVKPGRGAVACHRPPRRH